VVEVKQIQIANIYHMLAYAFQALREESYAHLSAEPFDNIHSLFAAILERGVSMEVKRGLYREYVIFQDVACSPRGKIDFASSVNERHSRRLVCGFDEFTENIVMNRIIKTCLEKLLRLSPMLRPNQPPALKRLLHYFSTIETIDVREIRWQSLSWHRHNASYAMLIHICQLLLQGLLQSEASGRLRLAQWLDEQHMHRLYEKFILAYFQREHPSLSVKSPKIFWALDDGCPELLPTMQTDVVLSSGMRHLIIEAKYYTRAMQINTQYAKSTFQSHNLYQIYAYVKNMAAICPGTVNGLLLYAKTKDNPAPDADYQMKGSMVSVRSLDLAADWGNIQKQLDAVAAPLYAM
jgi:5-methylcytosine-specific restriction enzyme subunit McrC